MKNLLSTFTFIVIFGGLAVLAFWSLPAFGDVTLNASPIEDSLANTSALAPNAPVAAENYNLVAMPLDASASITPFKASGLAAYHGGSVKQVLQFNSTNQTFDSYIPGISPPFLDFSLMVGRAYFLQVDNTSSNVLSLVGDVPAEGSVTFTDFAKGATPSECKFNAISIPLDQSGITNAGALATAIGGVTQVLAWNTTNQTFDSYIPGVSPPFLNFAVQIGYPYFVCLNSNAPTGWAP